MKRLLLFCMLCISFYPAISQDEDTNHFPFPRKTTEFKTLNNYIDSASVVYDSAVNIAGQKVQKIDSAVNHLSNSPSVVTDSLNAVQTFLSDSLGKIQKSAHGLLEKAGVDQRVPSLPQLKNAGVNAPTIRNIDLPENPAKDLNTGLPNKFNINESLPEELPELDERKINPDQFIDKKAANIEGLNDIKNQPEMTDQPFKELAGKPGELKTYGNAEQYKSIANQEAMEK